jgi:hypothetical protein
MVQSAPDIGYACFVFFLSAFCFQNKNINKQFTQNCFYFYVISEHFFQSKNKKYSQKDINKQTHLNKIHLIEF